MILEVRDIDAFYGLGHILHGLSLEVNEGEVVALLGRNGAGKTTTLRCITGLTPPRKGAIRYKGKDISSTRAAPHLAAGHRAGAGDARHLLVPYLPGKPRHRAASKLALADG